MIFAYWRSRQRSWLAFAAATIGLVLGDVRSSFALSLTGAVTNAGNYSIAQLQGLGAISETVGGDTYVGASLWTFLGGNSSGASSIVPSGGGNNPILRNYLIATGSDGSKSVISAGEIDPIFGGTGQPYLLAYQKNGAPLSTPALIVPQDSTGTRNVSQLSDITVASATRPPVGPGGLTSQFTTKGVAQSATYNLSTLQALPATTDHNVTFFNGANPNGPHDYTGVTIWSFINGDSLGQQQILTSYLLVTGSDGYQVLLSLAELNPAFGAPDHLIAYTQECDAPPAPQTANCGIPGLSLGTGGFARLVLPGDLRGGRYVSNISAIELASAVPEPASLLLVGAGLCSLVVIIRRRSTTQTTAKDKGAIHNLNRTD